MERLKKVVSDTKDVFRTKWSASEIKVPVWAIQMFLWITAARSLSYGFELLLLVSSNPISPLMAFANIFGLQVWGFLMLFSLAVFLVGVLTKRSVIVTIGTLLCSATWTAFGLSLGFGYLALGEGVRFVVAALATALTWIVFFIVQLRSLKLNGVGND